ncbi:MAG: RNase adapter RapZ [Armatimonadota bacterium]
MSKKNFIIITGLSGAGKSLALHIFEDMGYFCIDNLHPALINNFGQIFLKSNVKKAAIVIDIRGRKFFKELFDNLKELKKLNIKYEILFLEADDSTLISRFSETRRKHPLAKGGRVLNSIKKERKELEVLRKISTKIINTSKKSSNLLKEEVLASYFRDETKKTLNITVVSFGFKYGLPIDSDIVLDVRFMPNPFYDGKLQKLTGLDKKVEDYVLRSTIVKKFLRKIYDIGDFLIPNYIKEGKSHLTISIGCTGGRHRSVVITQKLGKYLKKQGYNIIIEHRDIDK